MRRLAGQIVPVLGAPDFPAPAEPADFRHENQILARPRAQPRPVAQIVLGQTRQLFVLRGEFRLAVLADQIRIVGEILRRLIDQKPDQILAGQIINRILLPTRHDRPRIRHRHAGHR